MKNDLTERVPYKDYPFHVFLSINDHDTNLLWNWCDKNKIRHFNLYTNPEDSRLVFVFKNEEDATAFKLRWI